VDTDTQTHTRAVSTMAAPKVLILCSKFEYILYTYDLMATL